MKAPISELTNKIIDSGEGHKLRQDQFTYEGKNYVVKKAPSYLEIEKKSNEE